MRGKRREVPEYVRDRSLHQRDVCKHMIACGSPADGDTGGRRSPARRKGPGSEREHRIPDWVSIDVLISRQIKTATNHGDGPEVAQGDHQDKQARTRQPQAAMKPDMSRADQQSLNQKEKEPGEKNHAVCGR